MIRHSVTLPNGQTATRNSKTRVYSHAIAVDGITCRRFSHGSRGNARIRGMRNTAYARDCQRRADEMDALVVKAGFTLDTRVTPEVIRALLAIANEGQRTQIEFYAGALTLARVDGWGALTWCGRADLAEKAARTAEADGFANVTILDVDREG